MNRGCCLGVSIVVYQPCLDTLRQTLWSLNRALEIAIQREAIVSASLCIADNTSIDDSSVTSLQDLVADYRAEAYFERIVLLNGHGNIGYGAGHNLASRPDSDYQLILNPDVVLADEALFQAIAFMAEHSQAAILAPAVYDQCQNRQYLCKRYPAVLDLLLRGFAPLQLRRLFRQRLYDYEMRDVIADEVVWDIPIVSGCFMLCRSSSLIAVHGFAPRYFLYFEDFDLSLRIQRVGRTVYMPKVRIVHFGGSTARKGWRHIWLFIRSGIIFFNRHGWKWF